MKKYNEMSEEKQLVKVTQNGNIIRFIKNPTERVQLEAVREDPDTILYIKDPIERVQLEAVKYDGLSIKYIKNPTERVQLEAVTENGNSMQFIKNPTERVQLEAVKHNMLNIDYIHNLEYNADNKDYPYYHIKNHKEYRLYLCDYRQLYVDMSKKCVKYYIGCQMDITKDEFIDRIYNDCDEKGNGLKEYPYRQEYLDIIDIVENEFKKGEM